MVRRKLRLRPRKSFAERLLAQASWMSPGAWIGQLAVLVFFFLLLGNTGWNRRDTLLLVTACTPLPGVIGLDVYKRQAPASQSKRLLPAASRQVIK